jgi:mRNA interferase MazF
MTRGDVVTISDRDGDLTGKPQPGVVVQSDLFGALDAVTVCPVTSTPLDAPATRLRIEPSDGLRLRSSSWVAVDKITTVRRDRIGTSILQRLNGALAVFLGLGG